MDFERGIQDWKAKGQKEAALEIVSGVFEILAQIPTLVATGPELAALPAVESALAIFEAAASNIQELGEVAKKVGQK